MAIRGVLVGKEVVGKEDTSVRTYFGVVYTGRESVALRTAFLVGMESQPMSAPHTSLPVLLINRLFCSIDYITNRNYRCQGLTVKTEFCLQPAIQSTIWTNRVQPKPHFTNVRSLDILLFHE